MKSVFCARVSTLALILCVVVFSGCVRQLRPDLVMSAPSIAGETQVKALLAAVDQDLAAPSIAAPAVVADTTAKVLTLSLQDAVLMGLAQNQNFQVERLKPAISRTVEEVERAAFDPVLSGSVTHARGQDAAGMGTSTRGLTSSRLSGDSDSTRTGLSLQQATSLGASVEVNAQEDQLDLNDAADSSARQRSWDLTITQALLRGRGPDVTMARLRQSRLDTEMSLYELQGAAEALVAQIEQAYWEVILAGRRLDIYQQSLAIAKQQVAEAAERIKVGSLAESELAAAEAEAAGRYQQLVAAQGTLAKARLSLLRLVNPGGQVDWQAELAVSEMPELPDMTVGEVASHVALALAKRPDLNQARLMVQRRGLEVTRTKNGLLPKLDLFVSLGGSRYSSSFAANETANDTAYAGGLTLELPLANRAAKAQHAAAGWSLEQANAALANMEQLVQVDVRSAHVDVEQAGAQVRAADATCRLREKTSALEQEKFRLGRSTTLLVAQAQRDLLASQIAQAEAVVGVRKAFLDLYRLEGSLLAYRGIAP